jgi:pimeloyl-ACP methyl ester carboxylesterase
MKKGSFSLVVICFVLVSLACRTVTEFGKQSIESEDPAQVTGNLVEPETGEPQAGEVVEEADVPAGIGMDGIFETAACPFDTGADLECGYLTVPENRGKADSPTIQLAVAILAAPDGSEGVPIIYLEGGPGGSPLAEFDVEEWDYPFTRNRDLIFIDQRGTGYSIPTLDCPELSDEDYDFSEENPEEDCRERLAAEGIDLTAYNTAENTADIVALRNALGIEQWDLLGISYGTRLALDVMRSDPDGIRSVVLDSPFPPNADTPVDELVLTYELMEALFIACEGDAYCSQEYPDLEAVFLESVAMFNENPADDLTGDELVTAISSAMQDTSLIPLIPYVIYEVSDGNLDALDEILGDGFARRYQFQAEVDRSDSEGMFNSVMCHDEFSFGDYDIVEDAVVGQLPEEVEGGLLQTSFEFFQTCDFWGAGQANIVQNQAVTSSIPTLILAGEFDTATPPQWARLTGQTLDNSFLFVFPGAGHSLLTTTDCSVDIIGEFLNDPFTEPDRTCIESIEWPYFE